MVNNKESTQILSNIFNFDKNGDKSFGFSSQK